MNQETEPQNQSFQQPQSIPVTPSPIEPKHTGNIWKTIVIILISVVVTFLLLVWYGTYLQGQDQGLSNNSQTNMSTLTIENIKGLKVASNVGNDYFIGSQEEQSGIVDMFIKDNSVSDSTYLYFAANTAQILDRPKDAMFLFFAAQLRKSFDYQRFEPSQANGNNIQTYLGYLNRGAGQNINPLAIQNPKLFSEAIRMIEEWDLVPADNAYYPEKNYGKSKLANDQLQAVAYSNKESFLNEFAYKHERLYSDPKGLEAAGFIQDYNFGKIVHDSVNDQKYQEYLEVYNTFME